MHFENDRQKFEYENNGRLDGELLEASWVINRFAYELAPIRAVADEEILEHLHSMEMGALLDEFKTEEFAKELTEWINRSSRIELKNITQKHNTLMPGVDYCIESLVARSNEVGMLTKTYYGVREMCERTDTPFYFVDQGIKTNTTVILELPTPNHKSKDVTKLINNCKGMGCTIALDLTYLPVSTENVTVDLSKVHEFWFSMNKTWPIAEIRPTIRTSMKPIDDVHSYAQRKNVHNRIAGNTLKNCIRKFDFDHTYRKYSQTSESIIDRFNVSNTNNLWLAHKDDVYWSHMPTKYWNYHNFIGLQSLIENQGKYFW
jgi:hypothetical protein